MIPNSLRRLALAFGPLALASGLDDLFVDVDSPTCEWGRVRRVIDASGNGEGALVETVEGIAVDAAGNVYVAAGASANAFQVTPAGVVTVILNASGDGMGNALTDAQDVALDGAGNVFVAGANEVFRIAPGGAISLVIGSAGAGAGSSLLDSRSIAVTPAGDLIVGGFDSDNAFRVSPGGVITEVIDASGDGMGNLLQTVSDVAADAAGNVYVAGSDSDNVFRITPGGVVTLVIDISGSGNGIPFVDPGALVTDGLGNLFAASLFGLYRVDPAGGITSVPGPNAGAGFMPTELASNGAGTIYASAWDRVYRGDGSGLSEVLGPEGGGEAFLFRTRALAAARNHDFYVGAQANVVHARPLAAIPVGAGQPATPFCYIGGALDVAHAEDTVHVAPGTYHEALRIGVDVQIVGTEGADATRILGYGVPVIRVENNASVAVDGLDVREGGLGVLVSAGASLALSKSTVADNRGPGTYSPNGFLEGSGISNYGTTSVVECVVRDNFAGTYGGTQPSGAGIRNAGTMTIANTTVSGNTVFAYYTTADGGGIFNTGTLSATNVSVTGNQVQGWFRTATGGGISNSGILSLTNTTVGNNGLEGLFGDVFGSAIYNSGSAYLDGVTVYGNASTTYPYWYYYPEAEGLDGLGTFDVSSSILWGSSGGGAPIASIRSATAGDTVRYSDVEFGWTGAGAGNLQVDPLLVDAANGDFALQSGSPCIDAGDPSAFSLGLAGGGNPRLLDGDLDRVLRVDMGSHELSHVRLHVTGDPTPGGTLTFTTTGTAGLTAVLVGGTAPAQLFLRPFGTAFVDPTVGPILRRVLTIPDAQSVQIPASLVGPLDLVFQEVAFGAPLPSGKVPGSFSNPVTLRVE